MPGLTLGIGATNPKKGAVQYDARRIDGVQFVIPDAATITEAPIGSIVTLQENSTGKQRIVLGGAANTDDEYDEFSVIGVGFLEAASQADSSINQAVGSYKDGDFVAMVSDVAAVASVPAETGKVPSAGGTSYITPNGTLSSATSGNVSFPGVVFLGTPGIQNTGQLKSGYVFARLKSVTVG